MKSSGTATAAAPAVSVPSVIETPIDELRSSMGSTLRRHGWETLKYLGTTEVHTYAFSVAANAILSFFPSAVLLLTLSRRWLQSPEMVKAIKGMLTAFLPSNQAFIVGSIEKLSSAHKIQVFSLVMLFISCTGVFEPLEVALNSVWGFKSRSYFKNQIVSIGLALGCGVLALLSVAGTAGVWAPAAHAQDWLGAHAGTGVLYELVNKINLTVQFVLLKIFGLVASVMIFFLIYWLLPNGKVPARAVLPAAVITGVGWEIAQIIYMAALPLLDFPETYGPSAVSVTLIFWAFFSGLLLLGGAHLSAADHVQRPE